MAQYKFPAGTAVRVVDPKSPFYDWAGEVVTSLTDAALQDYTSRFCTCLMAPPDTAGISPSVLNMALPLTFREEQLEGVKTTDAAANTVGKAVKSKVK
jgi:hypothetical protein